MTTYELFDLVTRIVASPHTAYTDHDRRRAIQVFLAIDEFLLDHDVDHPSLRFGEFAEKMVEEGKIE
jgi:hypothetical protein